MIKKQCFFLKKKKGALFSFLTYRIIFVHYRKHKARECECLRRVFSWRSLEGFLAFLWQFSIHWRHIIHSVFHCQVFGSSVGSFFIYQIPFFVVACRQAGQLASTVPYYSCEYLILDSISFFPQKQSHQFCQYSQWKCLQRNKRSKRIPQPEKRE